MAYRKKNVLFRKLLWVFLLSYPIMSAAQPSSSTAKNFSTAGFFELENSGRKAWNFNPGWRFYKGDIKNAEKTDFTDTCWEVVNLPHSLELVPSEASGCINYQGPAWYRKHFTVAPSLTGKKLFLYFEAIMGKSKIWINGKLIKENFGGYLPVIIDLSQAGVIPGKEYTIAIWTDNSDDPSYPPGKPQTTLDFAYFGGIYRDVWMVSTSAVHITDPNFIDKTAGGGVFTHFDEITDKKATIVIETDIQNESPSNQELKLETTLVDKEGKTVGKAIEKIILKANTSKQVRQKIEVSTPHLWHPDDPYLYNQRSLVTVAGKPVDGFYNRIGIRKIEFRGKDGFYLNNKPFAEKLIGGNRHQDYAYVGNALPNTGQWRDAKKLREAGMRIIRSAHYPQDPAFMDACDELGLFVIVATPGWQFWNTDSLFAQRIYANIGNMVRRDRNHASVIIWEPILNETRFPAEFAQQAYDLVHREYPYQGCFAACDYISKGAEYYDVVYAHPFEMNNLDNASQKKYSQIRQCVFTREWGDNVDDWSSHNSPSRVARYWGEGPQLIQAIHYANPTYPFTSYQSLNQVPAQHVGGCLWHPFDHQRGYHPDPFFGGLMDVFRQPKYSYYMFQSQHDPKAVLPTATSGPYIYIANEMTPFSGNDVVVFSNCNQVRLIVFGKDTLVQNVEHQGNFYAPVIFKDAYNFMQIKSLHRSKKIYNARLVAEGIIDNNVAITSGRMPSKRQDKIVLTIDNMGLPLVADGSDFVPVIASITDKDGNVKRLCKNQVQFTVEGNGEIIGDEHIGANPRAVEWGTAPVLIRSTLKPGKIRITATVVPHGANSPDPAVIEMESVSPAQSLVFTTIATISAAQPHPTYTINDTETIRELTEKLKKVTDELKQLKLKEVERDQEHFEKIIK